MKKLVFWVALLVVFVLPAAVSAQIVVNFWNNFSGGDGEFMSAMVQKFNETHPGIKVEMSGVTWEDYYNRLLTSIAGGIGPDVAIMHTTHVPAYASQGMLLPLDEELAGRSIPIDDYVESAWVALNYNGQQYGIPLDVHPWVLYYNKDILGQLGLLNAAGEFDSPTSPEEFRALIDQINDAGYYSLSIEYVGNSWRGWYALLKQAGGEVFVGNEVTINSPEALETLTFWASIPAAYPNLIVDYDESVALFAQGDAARHINGVWITGYFEQIEDLNFGVIPYPTLYDNPAGWANSHSFVIPVQRGGVDKEKLDAVLAFVNWMTENSYLWALAGHIPTRHSVLDSADFQALPYRPDYAAQADTVVYLPQHPNILEIETALNEEVQAVTAGVKTPEEALKTLEQIIGALVR